MKQKLYKSVVVPYIDGWLKIYEDGTLMKLDKKDKDWQVLSVTKSTRKVVWRPL